MVPRREPGQSPADIGVYQELSELDRLPDLLDSTELTDSKTWWKSSSLPRLFASWALWWLRSAADDMLFDNLLRLGLSYS